MERDKRKKARADPGQSHADPHHDGTDDHERHIDGNIHVRGEIETQRTPDLTQEHRTEREEDNAYEHKKFAVEIITLIFVILVAGLTVWQAHSAQNTAESAVIDQRPYVIVTAPGNITPGLIADKSLESTMIVKNIGRTPAIRIHQFCELVYFPPPDYRGHSLQEYAIGLQSSFLDGKFKALNDRDRGERDILEPLGGEDDIAPQGDFHTSTYTPALPDFTLTQPQIDDIKGTNPNGGALFVIGLITYTDNTQRDKAPYRTEFCWYFVGNDPNIWRRCKFHQMIR